MTIFDRMLALNDRFPSLRKPVWGAVYELMALPRGNRQVRFMNYGYAYDDPPELSAIDEADRYQAQHCRRMVEGVDLRDRTVLDVGCGRGGAASYIARNCAPREVLGMDLSERNVAICKALHAGEGNLRFVTGDAEELPFPSGSFDAVFNAESAHCYPSMERFFREVRRVLKPGGRFMFCDFMRAADAPRVRRRLEEAGFRTLDEEDMTERVARAMEAAERPDSLARKRNRVFGVNLRRVAGADPSQAGGGGLLGRFRARELVELRFVLEPVA